MNNKRKHAVEVYVLQKLTAKGLILLPLILDKMLVMDLSAVGTNLVASRYAEILVIVSLDEFTRYSECFIKNVYSQSAGERGYDVFFLACILAEQHDHA